MDSPGGRTTGAGGRGVPAPGRGRGGTSDRPCRFFAQGHCRLGARCTYSHTAVDAATRRPPSSAPPVRPAAAARADDDDPFRLFYALSFRQLERAEEFRKFLGAAISILSTSADKAETVLQMLCGVWRRAPSRNAGGSGAGLYGAASSSSLSSPGGGGGGGAGGDSSQAHLHIGLCLTDFEDRHKRGNVTSEVLCGRVFPLLRLLTHEAIRESLRSHWVNPLYDNVLHALNFEALATVYERLLSGEVSVPLASTTATAAATTAATKDNKWVWLPADWLDLLEPPLLLLAELLERFQQLHHRELLAEPAKRLTDALAALYDRHVAGGGGQLTHGSRVRRVRMTLHAVREQLAHGQARVRILDEQDAAQRRVADAALGASARGDRAAAERLRDPNHLPGELRPTGPRHDNDCGDYQDVRVVPTCEELLCAQWPYLPSNKPGSMPHLAHEPHRARLEINFRLLRHDVVAPLATALQKFRQLGGLRWLQQQSRQRQQQRAAATGRLELEGGSQLFVFRRVRVAGMAVTRQEGAYIRVTFEQPAMGSGGGGGGGAQRSAEEWWRNSKRLSHGTLLCFWWEPPPLSAATATTQRYDPNNAATAAAAAGSGSGGGGGGSGADTTAPEPRLVVGVVARRDAKELAGRGSPDGRPMVGIRLVQPRDHEALLGAWLDWEGGPVGAAAAGSGGSGGGGGGGSEVVLVQEHNSFFAYEPVLRALQDITTIPLAQYIVPGADTSDGGGSSGGGGSGDVGGGSSGGGGGGGCAELPAYWLDCPLVDLRHIADRERVMALPREEQVRVLRALAAVDLSRPAGQFPLEELLAASSLDRSQAESLRAALTQEVAVVQGPPGTGKTFLGVALARVLLRNTRSRGDEGDDDYGYGNVYGGEHEGRLRGRGFVSRPLRGQRALDGCGLPSWIAREVGEEAAASAQAVAAAAAAAEGAAAAAAAAPNEVVIPHPHHPTPRLLSPRIGPLLVVCFTNHALDSFLEGLIDSGVTTSIVRVGGSSRSDKLEQYNLRNLQGKAGGFQVRELLERSRELEERAEQLSRGLQQAAEWQRRPVTWDELDLLLYHRYPKLYGSFHRGRRPWNRKAGEDGGGAARDFIADAVDADADGDGGGGWQVATGRKRGQKGGQRRYSDLVSEDWLLGHPELDWRRRRVVLEAERQHAAAAAAAAAAQEGVRSAGGGGGIIQDSDEEGGPGGGGGDGGGGIAEDLEIEDAATVTPPAEDDDQGGVSSSVGSPSGSAAAAAPAATLWAAAGAAGGRGGGAGALPWLPATQRYSVAGTAPAEAGPDGAAAGVAMTPAQRAFAAAMDRVQRLAAEQEAAAEEGGAEGVVPSPRQGSQQRSGGEGSSAPVEERRQTASSSSGGGGGGGGEERVMEIGAAPPPPPPPPPRPPPPPPPRVEAPAEIREMGDRCRPLQELLAADDVWTMSRPERQLLHSALRRLRCADLLERAQELQDKYDTVQRQLQAEFDEAALDVLRSARVVGMTTSGVARNQGLVAAIKPRVLLVEEAAEVFEAHVLVCLSRSVEHLILIGDHEQLRPKPNEYDLQAASGRGLDLDVSLFERLVSSGATAARGAADGGGAVTRGSTAVVQVATLQQQRRMRPQISQLIRATIYPQLRDHPRVLSYPAVRGLACPLFFLDHDHPEGGGGGASGEDRSKNNDWEARFVVALARHLLLQGYKPEDLVILVPYVGQLFRVHRALEAANVRMVVSDRDREQLDRAGLAEDTAEEGGPQGDAAAGARTVGMLPAGGGGGGGGGGGSGGGGSDTGGGREASAWYGVGRSGRSSGAATAGASAAAAGGLPADSRVVTMREGVRVATVDNFQGEEATVVLLSTVRNNTAGQIGFLSQRNRVNVLLSRARHGMVVLGSAATLRAAAATAAQRGRGGGGGGGAAMWAQVLDLLERDGCVGPCLRVRCANHGTDTEIVEPDDFGRLVGDGGCQMPCGEALPCGHSCPRRCHADDRAHRLVVCTRPCTRLHAPCGHPCDKTCGEGCGRCERVLQEDVELPCGHTARGVQCWKRFQEGAITCRLPVEVTLPGCGHTATVPCCDARAAAAGELRCTSEVSLELPACGHLVKAACAERAALLADPTACPARPCGAVLGCGHECAGSCGECVRRVLTGNYAELVEGWLTSQPHQAVREAWTRHNAPGVVVAAGGVGGVPAPNVRGFLRFLSDEGPGAAYRGSFLTFLKARLAAGPGQQQVSPFARSHPRCARRCGKLLVCGHECGSSCHPGEPCSRCPRPCWISCPHHAVCRKTCGEPCVPCAEACDWRCPHEGRCRAPCGAPCERLPCDRRCEALLPSCGHRCPGLCGEPCPPSAFCVHPDCLAKTEERVRNQVVDQVMLRSLGELAPEELDEDPLVVLPACRHAFLTSTLDGLLGMDRCYARDPSSGAWLHPLPLGPDPGGKQPVKTCPQCREPIRGVRRYGRPINKASLDLMDRKHLAESAAKLTAADVRLKALRLRLEASEQQQQQLTAAAAEAAVRLVAATGQRRFDVAAAAVLAPADQLRQEAVAIVYAFNNVCDAFLSPPKARVYEAAVVQLTRMEEELAAAAGGAAGGSSSSSSASASALQLGLETARADLRALKPDNMQLCRAWYGILQGCELYLLATAEGLNQAARVAARRRQLQQQQHRDAARLQQLLRQQIFQRLMDGLNAYQQMVMVSAPGWIQQATNCHTYSSSFLLSEGAMRCGLAQLGLLQAARGGGAVMMEGGAAVASGGGMVMMVMSGSQLRELKQSVIDQARATGAAALALYHGESGFAARGFANEAITSIQDLMARLERFSEEIDMTEILSALKAVAAAEYGGATNAMGWLSGHLYRCPNGHPYVIGNCGGAMERSRCPECGETIGGGGHELQQGNAAASEVLQGLRAAGGGG